MYPAKYSPGMVSTCKEQYSRLKASIHRIPIEFLLYHVSDDLDEFGGWPFDLQVRLIPTVNDDTLPSPKFPYDHMVKLVRVLSILSHLLTVILSDMEEPMEFKVPVEIVPPL